MNSKKIERMIRQLVNQECKRMKGSGIGEDAQDALSYIATKNPISNALYAPIKGIADAFSASQSKLLDSAKARERGEDIFMDDQDVDLDDPYFKQFGITKAEQ